MKPFARHSLIAAALAALLAGCATDSTTSAAQAPAQSTAATPAVAVAQAQVVRQAIAPGLYEIVYSARQDAVFVASAGGRGEGAPPPRILRLHPQTLAVQAEIVLERRGYGLALDDAAGRLYVGNGNDAAVTVIDVATHQTIGSIQLAEKIKTTNPEGKEVERFPHGFRELVVDAANHRLYMPGLWFQDSVLYVVDTRSLKVEKVLSGFGFLATGITLDAQGGRLYVSNQQGQLFTVDTKTLAVSKAEVNSDQMLNLAFDRSGQRVFATDQGAQNIEEMRGKQGGIENHHHRGEGNRVVALNAADGKLLASLPTGEGPVAVLVDDAHQRLYVTNRGAGSVSVFDSARNQPLQTVALPTHPNSLALDARRNALFVTVKNGKDDPRGSNESVARIQF